MIDDREARFWNALPQICGALATGFGFLALLGWVLQIPILTSFGSRLIPMAPSTAILFVLLGIHFYFNRRWLQNRGGYRPGIVISSLGAFVSLLLFVLSSFGIYLDIEHLGIPINGILNSTPIGHMSPVTALSFLFVCVSLLILHLTSPEYSRRAKVVLGFVTIIILTNYIFVLAYFAGLPLLYGEKSIPPALPTSLAFLALGTALLACVWERNKLHGRAKDGGSTPLPYAIFMVFVILALIIVTTGYLYYRNYEQQYRTQIEHQLLTITDLKVKGLVNWRNERLGDANMLYQNSALTELVERYLGNPPDLQAQTQLQTWLDKIMAHGQYEGVFLMDAGGRDRISATAASTSSSEFLSDQAVAALNSGEVRLVDFQRDTADGRLYLALLVPIFANEDASHPLGILVLRIDPEFYLYPYLQEWPAPSKTAETLMVRREGDDVLYLNPLRFRPDAALNLRIPLKETEILAVKAELGQEGLAQGLDYRGVKVTGALRHVPDSPWFLVTRMDTAEVYAPLTERLWQIILLFGMLIVAAGAGMMLVRRQQSLRYYQKQYETAESLRKSQEQYKGLIEHASDGIFIADASGKYVEANPSGCAMLGYTREEILSKRILDLVAPEDIAITSLRLDEMRQGKTILSERRLIRKDGSLLPVEINGRMLPDGRFQSIIRDISERKQADDALTASEAELRALFACMHDVVLVIDREGIYRKIAPTNSDELADKPVELLGKSLWEVFPADQAESFSNVIQQVLETNQPTQIEYEITIDQPPAWFQATISKMNSENTLWVAHDITTRKQAEQTFRLQSTALNAAANGIVISEYAGTVELVNPAFTTLTGYTAAEAIGQNLPALIRSNIQSQEFYKAMWDTIQSGGIWHGEVVNRRKDGSLYDVDETITPLKNEFGEISHFIAIMQDITLRKQVEVELKKHRDHLEELVRERTAELEIAKEQAETANRAKSDFLAVMSHEIRTPLNGVLGMTHLIRQTELTDKQRDYLANLKISGETLMATINDILDYSRIESGKMTLEETKFDLENVLRNLSSNVAYRAQEKGLELVFNTEPDVPHLLVGDPARISQVLLNLAGNAIKFTEAGEVVVRTRLLGQEADKATVEFSVRDTGIGITAEQLTDLFQPFSQADSSINRKFGGSGLGLTISQRLVQLMGGEIRVESRFGQGSVFTFRLSLGRQTGKQADVAENIPELAGRQVLVVDDNIETLEAIRATLESFACRVTMAQNAKTGLMLLAEPDAPFELVFMDWSLPGEMDGHEAIGRIKHDPQLKHIPVILMASAEEMVMQGENKELDGYLIKPVTRSQLLDTMMQALVQKKAAQARRVTKPLFLDDLERLRGAKIMLVEDNEINQIVALEMLQSMGLQVSIANSGEEAVEMVYKMPFDAVLMDIQMPGMNGYQASEHIRTDARFTFERLPVIAMTANAMAGDREKATQAGMNDYVSKPVSITELSMALLRWIRREPVAGAALAESGRPEPAVELPTSNTVLDIDGALQRLDGNRRLYERLVRMFRDDDAYSGEAIRAALNSKDHELARRLAHTLKGVAGQIGADALSAAAKDLEMAIVEGKMAEYDTLLADVEQKLRVVKAAIATII